LDAGRVLNNNVKGYAAPHAAAQIRRGRAIFDEAPAARRDFRPTDRALSPSRPFASNADPRCHPHDFRLRSSFMQFWSWITEPSSWASLATLTCLEVVLGIDNLVFISIVTGNLPERDQPKARIAGIALALLTRILLLFCISWLTTLTAPWFSFFERTWSAKDIVLLSAGLFLIAKGTRDIHERLENVERRVTKATHRRVWGVAFQIMFLDILFSFDSVVTAVGMAQQLVVMVTAIVLAMLLMLAASGAISRFVNQHPTIKMLALAFLILIGVLLVAEGLGQHVDKGYIYFAMAFSTLVEMLNLRAARRSEK
jgi:predicted tellurium resistance membrane protein TerC